jgi:hypothetical protein
MNEREKKQQLNDSDGDRFMRKLVALCEGEDIGVVLNAGLILVASCWVNWKRAEHSEVTVVAHALGDALTAFERDFDLRNLEAN